VTHCYPPLPSSIMRVVWILPGFYPLRFYPVLPRVFLPPPVLPGFCPPPEMSPGFYPPQVFIPHFCNLRSHYPLTTPRAPRPSPTPPGAVGFDQLAHLVESQKALDRAEWHSRDDTLGAVGSLFARFLNCEGDAQSTSARSKLFYYWVLCQS
jgi:hypothetical protein